MGQRKQSKWKKILGKMFLGTGRVYRDIYGSSAGATTIDLPSSGRQRGQKRRHKRKH